MHSAALRRVARAHQSLKHIELDTHLAHNIGQSKWHEGVGPHVGDALWVQQGFHVILPTHPPAACVYDQLYNTIIPAAYKLYLSCYMWQAVCGEKGTIYEASDARGLQLVPSHIFSCSCCTTQTKRKTPLR